MFLGNKGFLPCAWRNVNRHSADRSTFMIVLMIACYVGVSLLDDNGISRAITVLRCNTAMELLLLKSRYVLRQVAIVTASKKIREGITLYFYFLLFS